MQRKRRRRQEEEEEEEGGTVGAQAHARYQGGIKITPIAKRGARKGEKMGKHTWNAVWSREAYI